MKLKIEQLQFELEAEKKRSRHYEGLSEIALLELKKGFLVNRDDKKRQILNALSDVEKVKGDLINCVSRLDNAVAVFKKVML